MITVVDERLRREAREHALRFACVDCAHFDSERSRCGAGFPHEEHLSGDLDARTSVAFCKSFELG